MLELVLVHLLIHTCIGIKFSQKFSLAWHGNFNPSCHMQITGSRTLTRLFAFTYILFPNDNDGRPISARRWAHPRQLSIRAHSTGGSEEKSTGGARRTLQAA